jgi:hypothetical protein
LIHKQNALRLTKQKTVTENDALTLSYKDYVFSFEFAALHYSAPEKNQYAYMLEGFDRDWNAIGSRRVATYTNLPAGHYYSLSEIITHCSLTKIAIQHRGFWMYSQLS